MKRVLGILAAGMLAVTPFAMANAEEHGHAADVAAEAVAPVDAGAAAAVAVVSHQVKLLDGTMVTIEGDMAFVMDAEGNRMAAPDGDHTLEDGTVLSVKEGKVVAGMPSFETTTEGMTEGATEAAPAPATEGGAVAE